MKDIKSIIDDNNIINKLLKVNSIYDKMKNISTNNSNNIASLAQNFYFEEDTLSRLHREFNEIKNGIYIGLNFMHYNDFKLLNNNIYEWIFSLIGPNNSPYSGGKFYLKIIFPKDYPKAKPEVIFVTPFYHLNVNPLGGLSEPLGHISTLILNWWDSKTTIKEVIIDICFFFFMCDPGDPYGLARHELYTKDRQQFNERIKYFTKKYANPSLPYKKYDT